MKESIKSTNENTVCSVCGSNDVYRYSMCSKCFAENQYGEFEDEAEKELTKAPKGQMHMHSADLRKDIGRGQQKISKLINKRTKISISVKKK